LEALEKDEARLIERNYRANFEFNPEEGQRVIAEGHHSLPKVLEDQTFDLVDLLPQKARAEAPLSAEE
jgi:hypothetical protein